MKKALNKLKIQKKLYKNNQNKIYKSWNKKNKNFNNKFKIYRKI